MKQFKTIFTFEFIELLKTKAYKITTLIFCLAAILGIGFGHMLLSDGSSSGNVGASQSEATIMIYDEAHILHEDVVSMYFPNATILLAKDEGEVKDAISEQKADAGFVLQDALHFTYYVYNSDMMDMKPMVFSELLSFNYRQSKMMEFGMSAEESLYLSSVEAVYESETLGSDGASNIAYTFILMIAIYMSIIMYGQIIATNVASEKGNRTMELLATSANPTALIFGKVLAGCAAATVQIGLFIVSAFAAYHFTREAWGGILDIIFNIPMDVLLAFAVFGILGFVFYAFIFGALGALVSKSEDVNSSATPITIVFVAIYVVVYVGMMDPSSTMFTIASYIPFSSPMAMFARMAMVEVPLMEVLLSLGILVVSTIIVGMGASKIYRRATLMYGNQIKLSHALTWLRKKD